MNKLSSIFTILVALNSVLHAQENTSFLQRHYKNFSNNMQLVKKCYFQKSVRCTEIEQAQAQQTVTNGLWLAAVLYTLAVTYRGLRFIQVQGQNPELKENIANITPVTSVEIRRSDVIVTVPDLAKASMYQQSIANVVNFTVPNATQVIITEKPLWSHVLPLGGSTIKIPIGSGGGSVGSTSKSTPLSPRVEAFLQRKQEKQRGG